MSNDFYVGQVLYWEPNKYTQRQAQGSDVTVTNVGRRWISLSNRQRIDRETMVADGGPYSPPGKCYLDKAARQAEVATDQAWAELSSAMSRKRPKSVSASDILRAAQILGINLEAAL